MPKTLNPSVEEPEKDTPSEDENQLHALVRLHWKKAFFSCAAVLLVIWGVAVVGDYAIRRGGAQKTELARYIEYPVAIDAAVTLVREETLLRGDAQGKLFPLVEAGERVAIGQEYAAVCASEQDAEALARKAALEQRLRWLKESDDAVNYHAVNVRELRRQVDDTFSGMLAELDRGAFGSLEAAQERFLYRSTTMEAALGGQGMDLSAEIAAVEGQLAEIGAMALESRTRRFKAPIAGYYYPQMDGYEEILTPETLKAVTPERWAELLKTPAVSVSAAQGRLLRGFAWYAVAVLDDAEAQRLRIGQRYTVRFPLESARRFSMKVESIQRGEGDASLVVLTTDEKDDVLLRLRTVQAKIVLATHKGLEIPAAALRVQEKTSKTGAVRRCTGVYIVKGSQLILREVQVLHQTDDGRAVVAWGVPSENKTLEGDRVTLRGNIRSAWLDEDGDLLVAGTNLRLTAENTRAPSAVEEGAEVVLTTSSGSVFDELWIKAAKNLQYEWDGGDLVATGEGLSYQENRGEGLKIYDAVLVKGRVPE